MKMLAILGSPRKNGNIAQMLDTAVKAAEAKGVTVDFIDLYHQNIAYCRGCMACKKTGRCVIDDDIEKIRKMLIECDIVAIACPVYFANVTASVKNMFDRLVAAVMDDNDSPIPKPMLSKKQKYILMTACNTPFPFDRLAGQSTGCLRAMREFFHVAGMKCRGKIVFAGTRGKTQPPERILKKIRSLI